MRGYSTGMRQRVKLAQALVHDPQLMLLDEPTNGLDPAGRDEMLDLVRRIGTEFGISILMSSHLLTEIERVCEYLVLIEGGRLIRSDSLSTFTGRTQVLSIEVDGPTAGLAGYLRERGYDRAGSGAHARARPGGGRRGLRRDPRRGGIARARTDQDRAGAPAPRGPVPRARPKTRRPMSEPGGASNIYDLGYRHYEGPRIGRRGHAPHPLRPRPAERLRARPADDEQDLPVRSRDLRLRARADPARGGRGPQRRRPACRPVQARGLLHLRAHHPRALLRDRRAGARRPRPAQPGALPLLLTGRLPVRLRALEVRRPDERDARAHARASAPALHRQRHGGRRPRALHPRQLGSRLPDRRRLAADLRPDRVGRPLHRGLPAASCLLDRRHRRHVRAHAVDRAHPHELGRHRVCEVRAARSARSRGRE